jgi:hypothetical protein
VIKGRPAWLLPYIVVAISACDRGPELSDVTDDFCRQELLLLELSQRASGEGRSDTILGDPSSGAFSSRVHTNFDFCRQARRIPWDEDGKISMAYNLAQDRYRQALVLRRDLNSALREMSAMIAAYRRIFSYPLR